VIVLAAMIHGVRTARARSFAAHRRATFHVLGQLSVAVTSRAMLFVLESSNMNPDVAYLASLWIPVLGTIVLVELLVPSRTSFSFFRRIHEPIMHPARAFRPGGADLG
jgi:hypothetical protein